MMITFIELAIEVLSSVKRPLSEREIWNEANKMNISDNVKSKGKTPWKTLGARIYTKNQTSNLGEDVWYGKLYILNLG